MVDVNKTEENVMALQKFTGRADDYTIGRPDYAESFIDYLYSKQGFSDKSVIADIGSGTGKFSKHLLDRGSFLYCVEPNEDMRNIAIKELSSYEKFNAVNGTAAESLLKCNSVDFVTTAQAFHWFDVELFRKECKRILKPEGKVILIWNVRDRSAEVNSLNYDIYAQYCPRFKGFGGGIKKDDERIRRFFNNDYEYVEFDNPIYYDRDRFISRCLSSSYSLKGGEDRYQEYLEALSELFDKCADNGILTIPNKTVAYIGNPD